MSKLEKAYAEAKAKFEASGSAEDELAMLRLEVQLKAETKSANNNSVDTAKAIAEAVANAVKQNNNPRMREVKQQLDKLIACDEVIVERSEKDSRDIRIIETIREGVKVPEDVIRTYNLSMFNQTRAKVLLPVKNRKEYMNQMGTKN